SVALPEVREPESQPASASTIEEKQVRRLKEEEPSSAPASAEVAAEVSAEEITLHVGERRYRVRGFGKNLSFDQLRINLFCSRDGGGGFHVDTLDLYSSRQRAAYVKQAAVEMGLTEEAVKKDLGQVLR